ncbi:MAG: acyl-CoA synthetase (AMP-forming)/AMP-acid ligase II [Desulforhopalus sp.]|jgi:acyl-CoA synthetase (AMP-forming)/AMP-acid ligase II
MKYAENIADIFVRSAQINADKTAIIEAKSNRSITFSELNNRADNYTHYFSSEGLCPGEVVILMVRPSIEFICLTLALFKLGTPVVLIDPGMGFKNLLKCIARVEPTYLVGIPKALLFSKIFPKPFKAVKKRFCSGFSAGIFGPNINAIDREANPCSQVYKPLENDLAAIIFTTGSTGPPKGVRYEHSIFSAQLKQIESFYKIGSQDIDQPAFPLFALFSTALGASAVIPDMDPTKPAQVDPEKFVRSIVENKVSYSFGSPAIWRVVSTYCIENKITLPSLSKVLMAGAPVPYDLLRNMVEILPDHGRVFTPYGATESLPIASIDNAEILSQTMDLSRIGKGTCVGYSLPGIDIRIVQLSDEIIEDIGECHFLETDIIGEIIVRGGVVTKGYMNNEAETRLAKIQDGSTFWHRMGDVGYLDESGRLWFCGRRAHRVVSGTHTFYSVPCEAIVNEHPDIYRSALVSVTNREGVNVPVLIVEPVKDFNGDAKKLIAEAAVLAKKSPVTKSIQYFLIHNNFPVDIRHNAKIFREKLSTWAQEKMYP